MPQPEDQFLTTKQLPAITGLSASFYEKGRIYGYGPPYRKVGAKVLYRRGDIDNWLDAHRRNPEGSNNE